MNPILISAFTCTSALGAGVEQMADALRSECSGLAVMEFPGVLEELFVGSVSDIENVELDANLERYDCRNHRIAELALRQDGFLENVSSAKRRFGSDRVGVVIGTSTSGIGNTEDAFVNRLEDGSLPTNFDFDGTHSLFAIADFVRQRLETDGPAYTISSACSSSTKAFVDGANLIESNICDAVVVGGVDSLCLTSLLGFRSLQLLAPQACRPNSSDRNGISIGEAGGFALLERPSATNEGPCLLGYGESSDAHHMSSPHPEGLGARLAMRAAIERSGLANGTIDYVNMHGTGTRINDYVEDQAIAAELGCSVACSSTKGWTGHALGAAGIVEAAICLIALTNNLVPGNLNATDIDPAFSCNILIASEERRLRHVLCNNFGFGGNNCCLIFADTR